MELWTSYTANRLVYQDQNEGQNMGGLGVAEGWPSITHPEFLSAHKGANEFCH